jgi:hypothetical protein
MRCSLAHYLGLQLTATSWLIAGAVAQLDGAALRDLRGRVADHSGGVAGAKVWAIHWTRGERPTASIAVAVTDEKGLFSFGGFWANPPHGRYERVALFVRDRAGRVGWQMAVNPNFPWTKPIRLAEVGEVRGRLTGHDGKPITGMKVVPTYLQRSPHMSDGIELIPDIVAEPAAETDAGGTFRLRGIPVGAQITAVIESARFGRPSIAWDSTKPVEVELDDRLGAIRGRLFPHEGPGLAGTRVVLGSDNGGFLSGRSYSMYVSRDTEVGRDGSFKFDGLPPGRYMIQAVLRPDAPYDDLCMVHGIEIGPGEERAGFALRLQRQPVITGRVVDAVDGRGLAGVEVEFRIGEKPWLNQGYESTKTDAQGNYRYHRPPDLVQVVPRRTETHTGLRSDTWPRLPVEADRRWPDLKMARAAAVEGIVVDRGGRPVPGAEVYVLDLEGGYSWTYNPAAVSGACGAFRLEGLYPDAVVPVLARTTAAATDGAVLVRPAGQEGRVKLVLDPSRVFRIKGGVKDRTGGPVAGAMVWLSWGSDSFSGSIPLKRLTTDSSGRFSTGALWPGYRYRLTVVAEGVGSVQTPEAVGQPGREHDLGVMELVEE